MQIYDLVWFFLGSITQPSPIQLTFWASGISSFEGILTLSPVGGAIRETRYLSARPALLNGCNWSATILTQSRLSATRLFWKNQKKHRSRWQLTHLTSIDLPNKSAKNLKKICQSHFKICADARLWFLNLKERLSGLSKKSGAVAGIRGMWVSSLVHVANTFKWLTNR